ncbi:MAG: L,D-transpeptidase [Patescibacteria group bacterium]|jgi:lipoprotein-anchoring transpeptidase ErfK/SrfK
MIKRSSVVCWCSFVFAACGSQNASGGDLVLETSLVCDRTASASSSDYQDESLLATVAFADLDVAAAAPASDASFEAASAKSAVCPPEAEQCLDQCCDNGPRSEPTSTDYVITREDRDAAKAAGQNVLEYLYGSAAVNVSRFNRLDPRFAHAGHKLRVPQLAEGEVYTPLPQRYEPAKGQVKFILVDLKRQFVGLYECGQLRDSFPISSGRLSRGPHGENYRTPTGTTKVRAKKIDAKSSKYPEPNGGAPMPYAVNFRGSAYWMHGGDLVGSPASHGCVRLLLEDAKKIFAWAEIGIPVSVVSSFD